MLEICTFAMVKSAVAILMKALTQPQVPDTNDKRDILSYNVVVKACFL